ncbi:MAG: hypothetical protein ABF742_07525, partial [Acetobacter orientalis]
QPLHPVEILFQNSLWSLKEILSLQTPPLCQTKRYYGLKAEYLSAAKNIQRAPKCAFSTAL